jgi:SAM-dependent methyltransferase
MKSLKDIYEGRAAFEKAGKSEFDKRKPYYQLLATALVKRFQPSSILDIGCSGGDFVYALRGLNVSACGIDISEYAVTHGIPEVIEYLQPVDVDTQGLPFKDSSFDMVTALGVIEHLQKPENLIKEAKRVLKPKGIVYILTPSPPFGERIWRIIGLQKDPDHINVHSQLFWKKAFHQQGFCYLGDLRQIEREYAFKKPVASWWGRLLLNMGMLGRILWMTSLVYARATFIFRLESK